MRALQSLYRDPRLLEGRTDIRVLSVSGLKQGCPPSPTLFGLLVDGLVYSVASRQ
jgi:hypothetical protein